MPPRLHLNRRISRRQLVGSAAAGTAAVALAACGVKEPKRSTELDAKLLTPAINAQAVLALTAGASAGLAASFESQAKRDAEMLTDALPAAGKDRATTEPTVADSPLAAATTALTTLTDAVGDLSTAELKQAAYEVAVHDAAQQSALLDEAGHDAAPSAFAGVSE